MTKMKYLKLRHPILFTYVERTKTGQTVKEGNVVWEATNVELETKMLRTQGDVLDAADLETDPNYSYEKQMITKLVYQLLVKKK